MSLHDNNYYKVVAILDGYQEKVSLEAQELDNYAVVNLATNIVEYTCQSLPQAKVTAEQYAYFLRTNYHNEIMKQMFGEDSVITDTGVITLVTPNTEDIH